MTIIAAVATDSMVTMGCDTAADYDGTALYLADGKILTFTSATGDPVLIGVAGNAGILSIIRRNLTLPECPAAADHALADAWADQVACAITALLVEANPPLLMPADGGSPACIDGTLLLAWKQHLWRIETNSAFRLASDVTAIGSGTDIALGSLYTSRRFGVAADDAVHTAIRLACTYGDGCRVDGRGPLIFTTESVA